MTAWRPRRPSARLRRRLFGLLPESEALNARWLWSGLLPTTACALLALMAINREELAGAPKLPVALFLSNQDAVAYTGPQTQTEQNRLAAVTFGWTNRSDFQSSIRFTPALNFTN